MRRAAPYTEAKRSPRWFIRARTAGTRLSIECSEDERPSAHDTVRGLVEASGP
jgi:hypothetical protein